jgi:SAM-dependent methyltransferase
MSGPTDPRAEAGAPAAAFDATAAAYELGRPEYPDAALDWWDERQAFEPGHDVLDLAAGTGKLTRLLPVFACRVVAVEPLANMRREFEVAVPDVTVHDGTAEALPFPDDSFDTVLVAQAFHWFDQPRALDEIARVLRPGGGLGLIWNEDDPSRAEWLAPIIEAKREVAESPTRAAEPVDAAIAAHPQFGPVEFVEIPWTETTTVERVLANALSRSYISLLPGDERLAVLTAVRTAIEHPGGAIDNGDTIEYPYLTAVFWTRRTE